MIIMNKWTHCQNTVSWHPSYFDHFSEKPYFDEIYIDSEYDFEESDDECPVDTVHY